MAGGEGGGLGMHLVLLPVGLPLLLDLWPARGVEVLLDARPVPVGTSVSSAPSGAGVPGVSRSQRTPALPRPRSALPLITTRSARWWVEKVFGGLLPLAILPGFPSFGWRSKEGS